MSQQRTFASEAWSRKGKVTRRERFLAEMDQVIPWGRLRSLIEPHIALGNPCLDRLGRRQCRGSLGRVGRINTIFQTQGTLVRATRGTRDDAIMSVGFEQPASIFRRLGTGRFETLDPLF